MSASVMRKPLLLAALSSCFAIADAAALLPPAGVRAPNLRSAACASAAVPPRAAVRAMFGLGGRDDKAAAEAAAAAAAAAAVAEMEAAKAPAPAGPATLPTPKTISDAKTNFQAAYGRPVGPIAQGFVNEMLSSCTVAMASPLFKYNQIFALGLVTLCDTFLEGMASEREKEELRDAIIRALGFSVAEVLADSASLRSSAEGCGTEAALLASPPLADIAAMPAVPPFKYSYAFGAGLLALMPLVGVEQSAEAIDRWCGAINISSKKLVKDWAFFESSVDKLAEVRVMMAEMKAAAKRKEAAKLKEQAEAAAKEADEAEAAAKPNA